MLRYVDVGSRVAAAQAMDALCIARDEAEVGGGDVHAAYAAIHELKESIAMCGCILRFDPIAGCHVVDPSPAV